MEQMDFMSQDGSVCRVVAIYFAPIGQQDKICFISSGGRLKIVSHEWWEAKDFKHVAFADADRFQKRE
jgi:hypothetical protein